MCPDATYFVYCLTPDDFTHQGESATTQWVNWIIYASYFVIFVYCLMPDAISLFKGESAGT
jgi:hypothetical protein